MMFEQGKRMSPPLSWQNAMIHALTASKRNHHRYRVRAIRFLPPGSLREIWVYVPERIDA